MNCPICNVTLVLADKQGIEIDYCPKCRGIWLDRGELEKIIERSAQNYPPQQDNYYGRDRDDDHGRSWGSDDSHDTDRFGRKKKRGMLGDLFDF